MASTVVDSKVVELGFNNQNFEQNAKTSLSTLEKLKSGLKFDGAKNGLESIDKASKKLSFARLASDVSALTSRFSTFGIIGMRVTQNLTDFAMSKIRGVINTLTSIPGTAFNVINEGGKQRAMSIENAHFQLQGLLKDEEKVQAVMDNAMESVDGTAYAYDSAALAASQFAASGLQAGDEMMRALKAITGVAAMTNSEYEDISRVFTTVAGNGRLMGDQLLQLSSRGLNAAATLVDYYKGVSDGSIEASDTIKAAVSDFGDVTDMTEGDIRELVRTGQISFELFSSAMDNAFGEHAKKANETFTGALSNMKAALKRIGAKFYTPIYEQNGAFVKFFNTLRVKINEVNNLLNPVVDLFTRVVVGAVERATTAIDKFNVLATPFTDIMHALSGKDMEKLDPSKIFDLDLSPKQMLGFQKVLRETAKAHGIAVDDMIMDARGFKNSIADMETSWLTTDIFNEAIDKMKEFSGDVKSETQNLEVIRDAALAVIRGDYGNDMEQRFNLLTEKGFDPKVVQDYVNALHEASGGTWNLTDASFEAANAAIGAADSVAALSDEELKNLGYTELEIKGLREIAAQAEASGVSLEEMLGKTEESHKRSGIMLIVNSISNGVAGLTKIFGAARKAWSNVFPPSSASSFYDILVLINNFSKKLLLSEERVKQLTDIFGGLFSALDLVGKGFIFVGKLGFNIVKTILSELGIDILEICANIGRVITAFRNWVNEHKVLQKAMSGIISIVKGVVSGIKSLVTAFLEIPFVKTNIERFGKAFKNAFSQAGPYFSEGVNRIKEFVQKVKDMGGLRLDNIGDVFKLFKEDVLDYFINFPGFKGIKDAFVDLGRDIRDAVSNIAHGLWDKLLDFREGLDDTSLAAKIIDVITGAVTKVKSAIENAFSGWEGSVDGTSVIGNIVSKVRDIFSGIGDALHDIFFKGSGKESIEGASKGGGGSPFSVIGSAITGLFGFVGDCISKLGIVNIIKIASLTKIVMSIMKFVLFFKKAMATINGITQVSKGVKRVTKSIKNMGKAKKYEALASSMKAIVLGIAVMAVAIKVLGEMKLGDLIKGVIALGVISILIVAIIGVLGLLKKKGIDADKEQAEAVAALAAVIFSMADAVEKLGAMETGQLKKGIIAVSVLGVLIIGFMFLLSKIGKDGKQSKGSIGQAIALIALAVVIKLLIKSISELGKMDDGTLLKGILAVGSLILILGIFEVLLGVAKKIGGASISQVLSLIALAFTIKMLTDAIIKLSELDEDDLERSTGVIERLIGALDGFVLVEAISNRIGGSSLSQAANLAALALDIYVMTEQIIKLAEFEPEQLDTATSVIERLTDSIDAFILVLAVGQRIGGDGGAGFSQAANLLALAGDVYVMTEQIIKLAEFQPDQLDTATSVIERLTDSIDAFILVLAVGQRLGGDGGASFSQAVNLAALAGDIYVMTEQIIKLAEFQPDQLDNATRVIERVTAAIDAFTIFSSVSNAITNVSGGASLKSSASSALSMIALAGSVWIMADALAKVGSIPTENIQNAQWAMAEIVVLFGILMVVANFASSGISLKVLLIAAVIAIVGFVFYQLAQLKPENVLSVTLGLSAVFLSLAALMFVLGTVGAAAAAGLGPLVGLIVIIGIVALVMTIIAGLVSLLPEEVKNAVLEGFDFLIEVAGKLGEMIGVFVSNLVSGGLSQLPEIATTLKQFMENLQGIPMLDLEALGGIGEALLIIGSIGLSEFFLSIGNAVSEAATGNTLMEQFADDLKNIAEGLLSWQESMEQIDEIEIPEDAISTLTDLIGDIAFDQFFESFSNAFSQASTGKTSMEQFTSDMDVLSQGLLDFQTSMDELGELSFDGEGIQSVIDMIESVPGQGLFDAIGNFFTGAPDMEAFSENLQSLGDGLAGFSDALGSDFDTTTMESVSQVVTALADVGNVLKGQQLSDSFFGGKGVLKKFGSAIINFGKQLAELSEIEMDTEVLSLVSEIATSFSSTVTDLQSIDLSSGEIVNEELVSQFKSGLEKLADAISSLDDMSTAGVSKLTTAVNSISGADISSAVEKLNSTSNLSSSTQGMSDSGKNMGNALASGISAQSGTIKNAMSTLTSSAMSGITTDGFSTKGTAMGNALAAGIRASGAAVKGAMTSIVANARAAISAYASSFRGAGNSMTIGFANGISEYAFYAIARSRAMALAALEAAKRAINSHSPSKETYKLGIYFTQGFVNAIKDRVSDSYRAGSYMAENAKKGLKNAVSTVKDILGSDMDSQPVIRPVLDLSDVSAGAASIGDMLSAQPIGIAGNLSAISGNVNSRNMTSNADVVSAISALKKSLGNSNGDTYNINGITYDDGSNITSAVKSLIREARVQRRA